MRSSHAILALAVLGVWGGYLAFYAGQPQDVVPPEMVAIAPGTFQYRSSGEFLKNGYPVDAPKIDIRFPQAFQLMKFQVSNKDYARCVAEGACGEPFKKAGPGDDEKPVSGVSFIDAENYARWLSVKTGAVWRLPSDEEWAYSAGSRFFDDALGETGNPDDPVARSLAKYKLDAERDEEADPIVKTQGFFMGSISTVSMTKPAMCGNGRAHVLGAQQFRARAKLVVLMGKIVAFG